MRKIIILCTGFCLLLLFNPVQAHSHNEALLVAGTAFYLYQHDQDIQHWAQTHRTVEKDRLAAFSKQFGEIKTVVPVLGAAYLYGRNQKNDKLANTALYGLESVAISGAVTEVLKLSGHRHRPNTGDPSDSWDGPGMSKANQSFPSGHTSTAFAVATVLATEYHDKNLVPQLSYGLAGLTALSRINDNEHWASDVFVGAAIGYYTAKTVIRQRDHHSHNEGIPTTYPVISLVSKKI